MSATLGPWYNRTSSHIGMQRGIRSKYGSLTSRQTRTLGLAMKSAQKQKAKRASKIMVRRKTPLGKQINVGGGESKSYFTLVKPNKTNLGKLELTNSQVVNNLGLRETSLIGKQNSFNLGTYLDAVEVGSLFTATGATGKTTKLVINRVFAESLITNQETSNARIYIYDVIARRDSQGTALDPSAIFQAGFADATGGAAANYLIPGATPYMSPRFTEYFKILKKTEVILHSGATHTHVVDYQPYRLFSHEIDSAVGSGSLGKLTVYSFCIHHGTPENDSTTKTSATVTLSASNLDVVQKKGISFTYGHQGYATNAIVNSLPTTFAVGGEVMNEVAAIIGEANA